MGGFTRYHGITLEMIANRVENIVGKADRMYDLMVRKGDAFNTVGFIPIQVGIFETTRVVSYGPQGIERKYTIKNPFYDVSIKHIYSQNRTITRIREQKLVDVPHDMGTQISANKSYRHPNGFFLDPVKAMQVLEMHPSQEYNVNYQKEFVWQPVVRNDDICFAIKETKVTPLCPHPRIKIYRSMNHPDYAFMQVFPNREGRTTMLQLYGGMSFDCGELLMGRGRMKKKDIIGREYDDPQGALVTRLFVGNYLLKKTINRFVE